MSNTEKKIAHSNQVVSFLAPKRFVVIQCISGTLITKFSLLNSRADFFNNQLTSGFMDVVDFVKKSESFRLKFELPFYIFNEKILIYDEVISYKTDSLSLTVSLENVKFLQFPNDCTLISYEYKIEECIASVACDGPSSFNEMEKHLFALSEDIFFKIKDKVQFIGIKSSLNWRYSYAVYNEHGSDECFPFSNRKKDINRLHSRGIDIQEEYIRNNIFTWEYAFVNLVDNLTWQKDDVLALVSYQCFIYYQIESLLNRTNTLMESLRDNYFNHRKDSMDKLIDESLMIKLELIKINELMIPDRVSLKRDYQAILRQLEFSFESDKKLNDLKNASQEMVNLVKYMTDIMESRSSNITQKVLIVLAFYALPGAIIDTTTFLGIMPDSFAPISRAVIFCSSIFTLLLLPYITIKYKSRSS